MKDDEENITEEYKHLIIKPRKTMSTFCIFATLYYLGIC